MLTDVVSRAVDRRGRVSPMAALAVTAGAYILANLVETRTSPGPQNPSTQRWYRALEKPPVTPPDAVFGGIWPILQGLITYGAFRLMRHPSSPERNTALGLWGGTLALVAAWGDIFFGARRLKWGTIEAAALVATAAAYVERAARVDRVAALAGLPITLWSIFGTYLTGDIARRNPEFEGREEPPRWR